MRGGSDCSTGLVCAIHGAADATSHTKRRFAGKFNLNHCELGPSATRSAVWRGARTAAARAGPDPSIVRRIVGQCVLPACWGGRPGLSATLRACKASTVVDSKRKAGQGASAAAQDSRVELQSGAETESGGEEQSWSLMRLRNLAVSSWLGGISRLRVHHIDPCKASR